MSRGNVLTIGALGLSDSEARIIKSIGTLTRNRAQGSYLSGSDEEIASCDIVVVNMDDSDALYKLCATDATHKQAVLALCSTTPPAEFCDYSITRPFGPAKLLAALDVIAKDLHEAAEIWKKPASLNLAGPQKSHTRLSALVIDDSPTVCKQLELELSNFNILADTAGTGEDGLGMLAKKQYDLVFLDVILPGMDGYQICRDIRKNSQTKQLPVIMLTSKSSPFDRVRGSLVGCSAYLTKPVDFNVFRETVGKYLESGDLPALKLA